MSDQFEEEPLDGIPKHIGLSAAAPVSIGSPLYASPSASALAVESKTETTPSKVNGVSASALPEGDIPVKTEGLVDGAK